MTMIHSISSDIAGSILPQKKSVMDQNKEHDLLARDIKDDATLSVNKHPHGIDDNPIQDPHTQEHPTKSEWLQTRFDQQTKAYLEAKNAYLAHVAEDEMHYQQFSTLLNQKNGHPNYDVGLKDQNKEKSTS